MNWEDDDNFGYNDEPSEDERQEQEKAQQERDMRVRNHPLYLQAKEILFTVSALNASIESPEERNLYGSSIYESALLLAPKISGAMWSDSWLLSMQNAALVRHHAEYLLTSTAGLKMLKNVDKQYVEILRDEMLLFKKLFKKWIRELHKLDEDGYQDEWGLFLRD